MLEDKLLVKTFLKERSEAAFLSLYRSKTPHLYQMALRITQSQYDSEELIQEMWIVAIRKLPDFQWRSELKTWLISILINLSKSRYRESMKMLSSSTVDIVKEEQAIEMSFATSRDLDMAIEKLPIGYRTVLVMYDIEGYKHKEIAAILEITQGTSKSQLFHARKMLRRHLSDRTIKNYNHD